MGENLEFEIIADAFWGAVLELEVIELLMHFPDRLVADELGNLLVSGDSVEFVQRLHKI